MRKTIHVPEHTITQVIQFFEIKCRFFSDIRTSRVCSFLAITGHNLLNREFCAFPRRASDNAANYRESYKLIDFIKFCEARLRGNLPIFFKLPRIIVSILTSVSKRFLRELK